MLNVRSRETYADKNDRLFIDPNRGIDCQRAGFRRRVPLMASREHDAVSESREPSRVHRPVLAEQVAGVLIDDYGDDELRRRRLGSMQWQRERESSRYGYAETKLKHFDQPRPTQWRARVSNPQ